MCNMKALILNVGNEVLSGKVVNTNSSFLAKELSKVGVEVVKNVVVADEINSLNEEIDHFLESNIDLLITTGGLGPTHDDFTKEALCERLGLELVLHDDALNILNKYFDKNMADCNLKQAYFPKNSILIPNKLGTADGAIFECKGKLFIILVGPPYELEPMVKDSVLPYLQELTNINYLVKEYIVMGEGESKLEDLLIPIYQKYKKVNIAPYASLGKIRYQLTALSDDKDEFNDANFAFSQLLQNYIISENLEEIEDVVVKELNRLNFHISFAESCTGGMVVSKIINVSGASSIINESLVTYSNEAKIKYLKVSKQTIDKYGVVSDEVIKEMLEGLYQLTNSEVCVAVSGIAGPNGGTKLKPVGLVHFGIKIKDKIFLEHKIFKGNRSMIRTRTTLWVLYRLFFLLKNY